MTFRLRTLRCAALLLAAGSTFLATVRAGEPDAAKVKALREKGINFLKTAQADDGSFTAATQPGITGLVVYSLLEAGVKPDDPAVAKGLKHLESFVQKDGGIYEPKTSHKNYETCIILMALSKANADGKYKTTIANAEKFIKGEQWDESEQIDPSHVNYGGAGYGRSARPDLSNTAFFLEALKAAGTKPDDPAFKKALVFVSRAQNLEGQGNTTPFAALVNDGGFYYTPAAGGASMAGKADNGGLKSYGSMTYAGLKSMIYAGVKPDDPRVKAAFSWLQKHYSVKENPGMGEAGWFYYTHTLTKTLSTMNIDEMTDADGKKHDWRKEVVTELAARQNENGSWTNKAERWMEGDPNLVTAYCLMTLSYMGK